MYYYRAYDSRTLGATTKIIFGTGTAGTNSNTTLSSAGLFTCPAIGIYSFTFKFRIASDGSVSGTQFVSAGYVTAQSSGSFTVLEGIKVVSRTFIYCKYKNDFYNRYYLFLGQFF